MSDHVFVRSVERVISAPPHAVFALLADPERHPDIDGATTVMSVKTSDGPVQLGSSFTMNMKRGYSYTTRNVIIDFRPDELIAWQTRPLTFPLPLLVGGRIWRYELTPSADGTVVRETWDIRGERNRWLVAKLGDQTEALMGESLGRLEELVTEGAAS